MSEIARIHPNVPLLETPVQETLPAADGSRIAWQEPRRILFRRIVRRDGTIIDFRRTEIVESIRDCLSQAGQPIDTAEELTDRVIIFLANRFEDRLLSTTDVTMAVETILLRSGQPEAARVYAESRRQLPPRVDGSDGNRWPWDRARIVAALCRETGLDVSIAEEIAREVEHSIIQARLESVTAPLVRELVNMRLLERGLDETRRKHARLGLPAHDVLRRVVTDLSSPDIASEIGRDVLSQLTFQQMLPKGVADLHREHILYVHDTDFFHLPRARRCQMAQFLQLDSTPRSVVKRLFAERTKVSHHLTIACEPAANASLQQAEWWIGFFQCLSLLPDGPVIELEIPGSRGAPQALSCILDAAASVAEECGCLSTFLQIVLVVNDEKAVPLGAAAACWKAGLLSLEVRDHCGVTGQAEEYKFSIDMGHFCSEFGEDIHRIGEELHELLKLIGQAATAPMRVAETFRRAGQSLLWVEPIPSAPIQLGICGIEQAVQWIGPDGWRDLAQSLRDLREHQPFRECRVQFAESIGESVRAWFGTKPAVPISVGGIPGLFDGREEGDPWKDLGPISRFQSVSEAKLSRALLKDFLRSGSDVRWGYAARIAWCDHCGKPSTPKSGSCPACGSTKISQASRSGWFVRETQSPSDKTAS